MKVQFTTLLEIQRDALEVSVSHYVHVAELNKGTKTAVVHYLGQTS
jgi:hypothetical protein